jgi:bifunctional enzyme CysN/CysC
LSASAHTKSLLRFLTAGSVDDGKSTLIGRLLYESGGVYEDQLASVRQFTAAKNEGLDLSLITDGLRAEREQAITIDVAYRYFSTTRRKFIIADAPGHEQYTRNMVTAASTADVGVILIDARKGVLEQTRRHAYIAWLLGIRCMLVAINKMDLVNFEYRTFLAICESFKQFAGLLEGTQTHFIPMSALLGDHVVHRSASMPWYGGPSLLELLETISIEDQRSRRCFRFPVQNVIRPNQDFRGYAGAILSGSVKPGQEVVALPSMQRTRIARVFLHRKDLAEAVAPQSVLLSLCDDLDLCRGDMLADPHDMPAVSHRVLANLIWMSQSPLRIGAPYVIRHTTQTLCGSVVRIFHKLDIHSLQPVETTTLRLNEIGKVEMETHKPMFCEPYTVNRAMGNFIVVDPADNSTVAGGMILDVCPSVAEPALGPASTYRGGPAEQRLKGLTVWFTGLSGAGKTTICNAVHTELLARGIRAEMLDGDAVRKHLNSDLGFSRKDRDENVRRIGFVAQLLTRNGVVVLVSAISPYRAVRDEVRNTIHNFLEVHVNAPLDVCEGRDPKGLYKKARAGEISGFTGIDDPYEAPLTPDLRCDTDQESIKASADKVVATIMRSLSEDK